jgi:hypothetical protein
MKLGAIRQQPNELLSYTVNYDEALSDTETAASTEALVEPSGELLITQTLVMANRVRLWATGGVSGKRYKVTVRTTTSESRVFEDELLFSIRDL